jgi:lipopolysaccharide transport system permease protein
MLVSFVMFPREVMLERFGDLEWILSLNPMYGIIQAYRHLALGMNWNPWHLVNGMAVASVLMVFGLFYFRKTERRFADIA